MNIGKFILILFFSVLTLGIVTELIKRR